MDHERPKSSVRDESIAPQSADISVYVWDASSVPKAAVSNRSRQGPPAGDARSAAGALATLGGDHSLFEFMRRRKGRNHYFVLSFFRSFSVSAAALPARYPASYSADRLLYDQSSTFGQWSWLICL